MVRALGQLLLRELEKVVSRSLALGHVVGHVRVHVHKRDILDSRAIDVEDAAGHSHPGVHVKLAARLCLKREAPQGEGRRHYVLAAGAGELVDRGEGEEEVLGVKPGAPKGGRVDLKIGDMLIYSGCDLEHWREPFEGTVCSQVFLHYNHANGPFAKTNLFDKRPILGITK